MLINPQGDLLVRPSFVELSIHNRPLSSSVSQHMLLSYRTSLAAVVKAQLDRRKRLHVRAWPRCMQSAVSVLAPGLPGESGSRVAARIWAWGPGTACTCKTQCKPGVKCWNR